MAATLGEAKISKSFASTAKIHTLCKNIEQPAAPFALRLSSALMLGVVRVFHRKSTIILADVNSILTAIKRYNFQQASRKSAQKRARDTTSVASIDNRHISLAQGEDTARFGAITLPVSKKRKICSTVTEHDSTRDNGQRSSGSMRRTNPSQGSFLFTGFSLGDSAELDVLTAMETVFPAFTVPHLADHLSSHRNSPTAAHDSGTRRKQMYAKEQDITLATPTGQLDATAYDMFDEDLQISLRSASMSDAEISQSVWMNGSQEHQDLGQGVDSAHNQLFGNQYSTQSPGNGPTVQESITPPAIEPLQLQPLELALAQELTEGSAVAKSATKSVKAPTPSKSGSMGTPSLQEVPSNQFGTPKRNLPQKHVQRGQLLTGSIRKRRSSMLRIDAVTELSPSQIRNFLNDRTDIVVTTFDGRGSSSKKHRRKSMASDVLPIPGILRTFPKDIIDLWRDVTIPTFTEGPLSQGADRSDSHRGAKRAPTRRGGTSRRAAPPALPIRVDLPVQEEHEEEPLAIPEVGTIEGRRSSIEVDRKEEAAKSRSNDQVSIPSRSQDGKSFSGGGNDDGIASSSGSRRLAELIDTVRTTSCLLHFSRGHIEVAVFRDISNCDLTTFVHVLRPIFW